MTFGEIRERLDAEGCENIPHHRTIRQVLKTMGLTKRRLRKPEENRNIENAAELRMKFCMVFVNLLKKGVKIIYLD